MKLLRGVAVLGAAKAVYDQARKPQNQARIRSAVARARSARGQGGPGKAGPGKARGH